MHQRLNQFCISFNKSLQRAIDDLKLSIDDKIKRGLVRRTVEASGDVQDVLKAFRTIANLVSISTVSYFGYFLVAQS